MNNNQIENHIRSAVTGMTPNICDRILETPITRDSGASSNVLAISRPTTHKRAFAGFAAAAAVLALTILTGTYYSNAAVASIISLDVNPSVEISANKNDRVVKATATNADGEKILGDMNLKDTDLNVATNAIIGAMVQEGYLSPEKNSILVTVSAKDENKSNELRYNVVSAINETLSTNNIPAHIYNQTLPTVDKKLKAASQQHGISYSKLSFLEKITAVDPTITLEQLSKMTLNEIDALLAKHKVKLDDIDLDDDDDDYCDYCGKLESSCRKTCDRTHGKRYCDDCGKLFAQCICTDKDDADRDYCDYCGKLESVCRNTCDRTQGKRYCDDCGKLSEQCSCTDKDDIDDDDDDDDVEKENNRYKDKNDNRPENSNANTENSNRYKDKNDSKDDDDDDYCDYCGKLESVCKDKCSHTDGKRYCDDCEKPYAQCVCDDDDDNRPGNSSNKDKDKGNKPADDDDDDDDRPKKNNGNNGNNHKDDDDDDD